MSDRGASAAVLAQLAASENQPVHLFYANFDGAPTYACNAYHDIDYDGNTYSAAGHFLGFRALSETSQLQLRQVTITLSGVDGAYVSDVLNQSYIGRDLRIMLGFLKDDHTLESTPLTIFEGFMDAPTVTFDPNGKCTVELIGTSDFAKWDQTAGRRTNDAEQQALFPGDRGFQFATAKVSQVSWGGTTVSTSGGGPGGPFDVDPPGEDDVPSPVGSNPGGEDENFTGGNFSSQSDDGSDDSA